MTWHRTSETSMRCEPWTVAKVFVGGQPSYELWHDKAPVSAGPWGRYASFAAAKEAAELAEIAGQG